jgi:hypothetical protein
MRPGCNLIATERGEQIRATLGGQRFKKGIVVGLWVGTSNRPRLIQPPPFTFNTSRDQDPNNSKCTRNKWKQDVMKSKILLMVVLAN